MTTRTSGARHDDLSAIERACWHELERAIEDHAHPWHVVTLATVEGERAEARCVVLRGADPVGRRLDFFTDARSAKVRQIAACPHAMLVAWWPERAWQLRLRAALSVETEGLGVSSRWARVKLSPGARDYVAALPPGTPVDRWQPERGSRAHFAVVTAQVLDIDWMELHPQGHRRARLAGDASTWLSP